MEQILSNLNSLTGKINKLENNMTNTAKETELRLDSIDERLTLSNNIVKEMEFRLDSIEERLTLL